METRKKLWTYFSPERTFRKQSLIRVRSELKMTGKHLVLRKYSRQITNVYQSPGREEGESLSLSIQGMTGEDNPPSKVSIGM